MVVVLSTIDHGSGSLGAMRGTESAAARIIGERIAGARLTAGASRLEVAYHAKVDATNLGRYETGKALPNLAPLVRLAETLGVDPGSLVAGLVFADFPQDRETPQPIASRRRGRPSTA